MPMNRFIFSEEDFLPASVTDQKAVNDSVSEDQDGEDDEPLSNLVVNEKFTPGSSGQSSFGNQPSTSNSNVISPKDILPIPKISQNRKRMRKGKKSEILTSTPNKEELEREREMKLQK